MDNVNNEVVAFYKQLGFTLIEIKSSVFRIEESTLVFQTDHKDHTVDASTILYEDAERIYANTVTAVLDEIEREVEEHGNKVLGLYGGRLPYTFFGGNEEDNRMQIYLAAHKDIIKTIIKSKRTEV